MNSNFGAFAIFPYLLIKESFKRGHQNLNSTYSCNAISSHCLLLVALSIQLLSLAVALSLGVHIIIVIHPSAALTKSYTVGIATN
jgi:hypothetical protein